MFQEFGAKALTLDPQPGAPTPREEAAALAWTITVLP
jgi:hypothetical protein